MKQLETVEYELNEEVLIFPTFKEFTKLKESGDNWSGSVIAKNSINVFEGDEVKFDVKDNNIFIGKVTDKNRNLLQVKGKVVYNN